MRKAYGIGIAITAVAGFVGYQSASLFKDQRAGATTEAQARINGSNQTIPFGSTTSVRGQRAEASLTDLRAKYLSAHDKFAFYKEMLKDPRPEARYFAFRAARECSDAMSRASDANDLRFSFNKALAESPPNNPELGSARRAAFEKIVSTCGGFARPEVFPSDRDLESFRIEAANAAFPAAEVAKATLHNADKSGWERAASLAQNSRDPLAFDEAKSSLLALSRTTPMAGTIRNASNSSAVVAAFDLASCRMLDNCDGGNATVLGACAFVGACTQKGLEELLLAGMTSEESQQTLALADRIVERFNNGTLIAPTMGASK